MVTREELKKWQKGYLYAMHQKDDLVKDKKIIINNELNLIPESDFYKRYNYLKFEQKKNLVEKHQNEIDEKRGKKHPVFFIVLYNSEIDEWLTELIAMYEKLLPFEKKEVKLKEELNTLPELTKTNQAEERTEIDTRIIKGKLEKNEIERYFMQLASIHSDYPESNKERICVLTATQVKELLSIKSNNTKFDTPNFTQQQLRIFIYTFKKLHKSKDNTVLDFVNFEINSFTAFEGLLPEKEYSNFNKGNVPLKPPYNRDYTN